MQIEHRIHVAAPPKRIFALYADVANGPLWWDPDTKAASIEGLFQTGAVGRLTPTRGNTFSRQGARPPNQSRLAGGIGPAQDAGGIGLAARMTTQESTNRAMVHVA
jgi:hypothetical protein